MRSGGYGNWKMYINGRCLWSKADKTAETQEICILKNKDLSIIINMLCPKKLRRGV